MLSAPPLLYQDTRVAILNKPAGLPCHPSRAGGPSVESWFPPLRRGAAGPWLAHRLDQDTAGCLVLARRKSALIALQAGFASGQVTKIYWAVVIGTPSQPEGQVRAALGKHRVGNSWRIRPDPAGQPAETGYQLLASAGGLSLLALTPRTGRTHQIRVHCATLGCPIWGDAVYGQPAASGLCLLARAIHLPLDPPVAATAPLPPAMLAVLAQCAIPLPQTGQRIAPDPISL